MGEARRDQLGDTDDGVTAWEEMLDLEESTGSAARLARLRASGPVPRSTEGAPLIVDTDIGGDPDDAVAVALAAREVPELALVLTADECGTGRARFARRYLDALGRPDVPVVAGADLGNDRYFCVGDLLPAGGDPVATDLVATVARLLDRTTGPVRWLGIGPMSNLAAVLAARPDAADRLRVTQMGGAFRYRHADRAEHNVRLDVPAARAVLAAARRPTLVLSDVTFTERIEITRGSALHRGLADGGPGGWTGLLAAHLDRWFDRSGFGSMMHDPLTLSVTLELPFVRLDRARIGLDDIGRTTERPEGSDVRVSASAAYDPFRRWLADGLGLPGAWSADGPAAGPG